MRIKKFITPLLLVGTLLLSACATPAEAFSPVDWVEPGWMAAARQSVEEYQTAFMACLAERGVVGVSSLTSATVGISAPRGADGNFDRALHDLGTAANNYCLETIPWPEHYPQPPNFTIHTSPEAYERMLDVRNCLIAHGIEVPEPPTMERWMESSMPWSPWNTPDIMQRHELFLHELSRVCPQDGISAGVSFF